MNVITIDKIRKNYGVRNLFNELSLTITDSDKIGLIGVNGTGKTTLLNIISGKISPDKGSIQTQKNLKVGYLNQSQSFETDDSIYDYIYNSDTSEMNQIKNYDITRIKLEENPYDAKALNDFNLASETMKRNDLWDMDISIKTILSRIGIENLSLKVKTLSGGMKKRVALATALINPCELLILDEPTNHLDGDTILWLETYLRNRKGALILVTHDRYFLDRVTNKILELDQGNLYSYSGNYAYYLDKKATRIARDETQNDKLKRQYDKELSWIRSGVQGRGTKSKSRIQRFNDLSNSMKGQDTTELIMPSAYSRLGKKIIDIDNLEFGYSQNDLLFKNFSYHFMLNDRIGIVGNNGAGKSTLLKLITSELDSDIQIGETVKFGYFKQETIEITSSDQRAIEYIKEFGEYVKTDDGTLISASDMMTQFLFSKDMQWTPINKLSGGEKRRLQLLSILMGAPNVLIFDEPTNDLDIETLKILESYLDHFIGVVICVSHDRYFLDRVTDILFVFKGKALIEAYHGAYSTYLENETLRIETETSAEKRPFAKSKEKYNEHRVKLSYQEEKALKEIPLILDELEESIEKIDIEIEKHQSDFQKLQGLLNEKDGLEIKYFELLDQLESIQHKLKEIKT